MVATYFFLFSGSGSSKYVHTGPNKKDYLQFKLALGVNSFCGRWRIGRPRSSEHQDLERLDR